jgi:hypothetical protein
VVGRPPQTISVMTNAVRLISDFAHFPPTGITVNWRAGQVIQDPAVIALLTRINAPIEPIAADTPQQGANNVERT